MTLSKRTREGKTRKLTFQEKLKRIRHLERLREAQLSERIDFERRPGERDVRTWTKVRKEMQTVMDLLVREGKLTRLQREIIYSRFYFDRPEMGGKNRSFEEVAKVLNKKRGSDRYRIKGRSVRIKKLSRDRVRSEYNSALRVLEPYLKPFLPFGKSKIRAVVARELLAPLLLPRNAYISS